MLRLTGAKADGWLASLDDLEPGMLRTANKMVDEAPAEAGRDSSDIRPMLTISGRVTTSCGGMLHGPSTQWVEQLLPLVVEEGVGTLILATDDPATLQRFAHEVAPALREAVDQELPAPLPISAQRSTAVRAKRRAGIDYDAVPASLASVAAPPTTAAWSSASRR